MLTTVASGKNAVASNLTDCRDILAPNPGKKAGETAQREEQLKQKYKLSRLRLS